MFESIVREILDELKGDVAEDIKSEIHAAALKHMATLLYLAAGSHADGPGVDADVEARLRWAAEAALMIDARVEVELEEQ